MHVVRRSDGSCCLTPGNARCDVSSESSSKGSRQTHAPCLSILRHNLWFRKAPSARGISERFHKVYPGRFSRPIWAKLWATWPELSVDPALSRVRSSRALLRSLPIRQQVQDWMKYQVPNPTGASASWMNDTYIHFFFTQTAIAHPGSLSHKATPNLTCCPTTVIPVCDKIIPFWRAVRADSYNWLFAFHQLCYSFQPAWKTWKQKQDRKNEIPTQPMPSSIPIFIAQLPTEQGVTSSLPLSRFKTLNKAKVLCFYSLFPALTELFPLLYKCKETEVTVSLPEDLQAQPRHCAVNENCVRGNKWVAKDRLQTSHHTAPQRQVNIILTADMCILSKPGSWSLGKHE